MPPNETPELQDSSPPAAEDVSEPQDETTPEPGTTADDQPEEVPKSFQELGIIDSLCDACTELGYKASTPIQKEAIPLALQGKGNFRGSTCSSPAVL